MCLYNVGTGNEQNNQGSDWKLGEGALWRLGERLSMMDVIDGMNLFRCYWLGSTNHRNQSPQRYLKWTGYRDEKRLHDVIDILMASYQYTVTPRGRGHDKTVWIELVEFPLKQQRQPNTSKSWTTAWLESESRLTESYPAQNIFTQWAFLCLCEHA